jgi:alpha-ketoglutarate-dependent taurine dioxygenase
MRDTVTVTQIQPEIGAEIRGISGSAFVDAAVALDAQRLLDAHGVLVYRGANIGDADLSAFSRLLGPVHVFPSTADSEYPAVSAVSLDPEVSKSAAVQRGTFQWHIDGTMVDYPHRITLLSCLEPANDGSGDTEFANTYAAYEALSDAERAELEGLQVRYSYLNRTRIKQSFMTPEAIESYKKLPPRDRPLLWTNHAGRTSMLLGSQAGEVIGWSLDEGEAFLGRLLEWATQSRFTMRHRWERGDLVLWDNTGILHRAHPYEPASGRLMHRTTIDSDQSAGLSLTSS